MLRQLRRDMVRRDQNIREGFVIPQQHVEPRLQLLDVIRLEQQRFRLGLRRHEFHRRRFGNHPRDAARMPNAARIIRDPLFEAFRLPHIQHRARIINHTIHARHIWQCAQRLLDHLDARLQPERRCIGLEIQFDAGIPFFHTLVTRLGEIHIVRQVNFGGKITRLAAHRPDIRTRPRR